MQKISSPAVIIALFALWLGALIGDSNSAQAAGSTAYLSSGATGNCTSPTSPCSDLLDALTVAGLNGEIICLNRGNYGSSTYFINGSVTISCGDGLLEMPGGTLGINGPAGTIISIEGLVIDTRQSSNSPIQFSGQGSLRLHNVRVGNTAGTSGHAVWFKPTGPSTLHVSNSVFYTNSATGIFFVPSAASQLVAVDTRFIKNGSGATGAGIRIYPSPNGSAQVTLERVSLENNVFGLAVDGYNSTGGINLTITDSAAASNTQDGIIATTPAGGSPIAVMVKNSRSTNNNIGIRVIGNNVAVRVSGSTVAGNATGLVTAGSSLLTFGNNEVRANGSDGAFTGSVGLQ